MKIFPGIRLAVAGSTLTTVILPLLVLALVIAAIGSYVYASAREAATRDIASNLTAIARLKVGQIRQWLGERINDVDTLSAQLAPDLERWLEAGARGDAEARLGRQLRRFAAVTGYPDICLHLADGRLLLTTDAHAKRPGQNEQARRVAERGRTELEDFHAAESGGEPRIDLGLFSPVVGTKSGRVLGVIHVTIDPGDVVFPLLQQWPGASRSAETVLLRQEGDDVRFLNALRHVGDAALRVHRPLSMPGLIGARIVREGEGFFAGSDYRGVPSFGYGLPVPGTPWYLIAKIDRDEALAQLYRVTNLSALVLFALLALSAGWLVYRNRMASALYAALEESEDLYQNAPCGYHSIDRYGVIRRMNDTELALLGYHRDEVVGRKRIHDLVSANAPPRLTAELPRFYESGRIEDELEFVRKDGSVIPVLITARAIRDAEGRHVASRIMVVDMTERKRIEQTQFRLNRTIRLLSQCNSLLVHAYEEQSLLRSICRLIVDLGGYRTAWVGFAEQDVARSIRIATSYGDDAGYLDGIKISWADDERGQGPTGTAVRTGTTQINRDFRDNPRTTPWREAALAAGFRSSVALPLADKHGVFGALTIYAEAPDVFSDEEVNLLEELADNFSFGIAHLRESLARRQAEDSLRKLSRAVEQSPESILITDVDTTIEYVNDAFIEISGYNREEAIGRKPTFLQSGNTPPETYASLWAALTQGKAWKGEFHNRRKDGSEYVEFAVVAPIRQPDGSITHYVALKEDITEKKRLGLELDRHRHRLEELVDQRTAELALAKAAAEAANVAKSAFLANMSHEIRTPLNAIIGLTRQLRQDAPMPAQAGRLDKIDTAAAHLLSIIDDILDFSKIEAGKLTLEQTDFRLAAVFDQVRALVVEPAEAKALVIEVDLGDAPAWLRGDPTRLRQALLNFAANAVKFTERGRIKLGARLLQDAGDALTLRFAVEDSGIGIAAAQLPHLFQPFHQADATTTRRYGGTGLGLVITQRLAGLMGGEAGVRSEPGVGSTFWFTARLGRGRPVVEAATPADARAALRERHPAARVLLVEDDLMNQEIALSLLAEAGLGADVADDGAVAVAMAAETDYALILMDMQMPEMDGIDATQVIRALPGRAATPILAITANAFDADRRRCLDAGMDDFVAKPLDPNLFFAMLYKWLGQRPSSNGTAAAQATPPPPGADELRRRLGSVGGVDLERVLKGMPGRITSYARLLRQYVDNCRRDATPLARHAAAGSFAEVARLAHSLKGNAGFLGLTRIQAMATALDGAIRTQRPAREIEDLAAALDAEQAELADALLAALDEGSEPAN